MEEWFYNDLKQTGTNYENERIVAGYDAGMIKIRDIKSEVNNLREKLKIKKSHIVLELGTGTGRLALGLAPFCREIHGVDISQTMLKYAVKNAKELKIRNIKFIKGSFLSYRPKIKYDIIYTNAAMHHLPDFWKQVAILNIYSILKKGGRFWLGDVIYTFPAGKYREKLKKWIKKMEKGISKKAIYESIRDEYETFDWAIERMLKEAGFKIKVLNKEDCFANYMCIK